MPSKTNHDADNKLQAASDDKSLGEEIKDYVHDELRSEEFSKKHPFLKRHITFKTWRKIGLVSLTILIVIIYFAWDMIAHGPVTSLLSNRDELIRVVESWGPLAPLLYIILQILQTVVAPIPGQIVGSIGGFLFGGWGILWTSIGTLIGCYIVFRIARRFGRPLLEKIFKKSAIDQFDFIINSKSAALILFLIFLLPGFPDDVICYIAGLTCLPIRNLMMIVILGRLPVIVVTNIIGDGIATNIPLVVFACVVSVVILGLAVWQRERIMAFLKRDDLPVKKPKTPKPAKSTPSPDAKKPDKSSSTQPE